MKEQESVPFHEHDNQTRRKQAQKGPSNWLRPWEMNFDTILLPKAMRKNIRTCQIPATYKIYQMKQGNKQNTNRRRNIGQNWKGLFFDYAISKRRCRHCTISEYLFIPIWSKNEYSSWDNISSCIQSPKIRSPVSMHQSTTSWEESGNDLGKLLL